MCTHIRYERCIGNDRLCERRLKYLKIRLYDIKNVVLQRRITYISAYGTRRYTSSVKPPHILSYCDETVKIISSYTHI